jgi:hypothetical protein
MEQASHWIVVGWIGLHLIALASACGTRLAAGSRVEGLMQLGFFAAMAAVGVATWIGQHAEIGWTWSAMTLMAMVITAVVDFRRAGEPAHASIGY